MSFKGSPLYRSGFGNAYWAVQDVLPIMLLLFDVALERIGVERLKQLEATKQLRVDRHDGSPVVEFATVLRRVLCQSEKIKDI